MTPTATTIAASAFAMGPKRRMADPCAFLRAVPGPAPDRAKPQPLSPIGNRMSG
jgi:hypothetical protein